MKIVFLDVKTIGEDIDLSGFDRFGEVVKYDFSTSEEVPERVQDADVIILNKVQVNEQTIGKAENLKLVCVTATGTNNLDKEYLEKRGVAWRNVAGYSTETVAQHTFAMLLYLLEKMRYYDDYVKEERYINDTIFTHFAEHFTEISGKTWGIIGLGTIGRRVADIAKAFGAQIIYYSASGRPAQEGYEQVDLDTLLAKVDQIGAACHTGNPTCFFQPLVGIDYDETNPLRIFESVYDTIADRKENPKEGSYTNYLFDKGIDKILKKIGEEATEVVIAAKNPNPEEVKYEIADFLYHAMVLMVEKGLTWEDIVKELADR